VEEATPKPGAKRPRGKLGWDEAARDIKDVKGTLAKQMRARGVPENIITKLGKLKEEDLLARGMRAARGNILALGRTDPTVASVAETWVQQVKKVVPSGIWSKVWKVLGKAFWPTAIAAEFIAPAYNLSGAGARKMVREHKINSLDILRSQVEAQDRIQNRRATLAGDGQLLQNVLAALGDTAGAAPRTRTTGSEVALGSAAPANQINDEQMGALLNQYLEELG
jgi:hypothetical protein